MISAGAGAQRTWFAAGAGACGAGVLLGAFGAHALRVRLAPDFLDAFETGVRYQLIHGLALLVLAVVWNVHPATSLRVAAACFLTGILLFSGSLYALALSGIRWFGAVTPLGGIAFLAGWTALVVGSVRRRG